LSDEESWGNARRWLFKGGGMVPVKEWAGGDILDIRIFVWKE
jgi:hypothetical protein